VVGQVTEGLTARLRSSFNQRADFSEVFAESWISLPAATLAERPIYLERDGRVPLGDLFDIKGHPDGQIRIQGDLEFADRVGARLSAGRVMVEGSVGAEAGLGMSGGALVIQGNAGPRAGAAPLGYKRGMTGGELIIRGAAGSEAGAAMRRGVLVIERAAGERAGLGMIAGSIIVFGSAGKDTGLWSKRGSVVALGQITPPATYVYACTYHPVHLRLLFTRLRSQYGVQARRRHLTGLYRRYSGDLSEIGKGEILQWTAT
jgi:formylmethanofuran dehydrogenase subunit C